MLASIAVEEALLVLKIVFVVLLYLFIWRIVRTASRDLRLPQESFVLAPSREAGIAEQRPKMKAGRIVVAKSPVLDANERWELNSAAITIGRSGQNDVTLDGDEYASAKHARIEPRLDGVWLEDMGSTNGTYLNGIRVTRPRKLTSGDIVRIGDTELRYET